MSKKITTEQIEQRAKKLGIEIATLRAVLEVECRGSGFNIDETPVILFERHVFRQRLIANGKSTIADQAMRKRPDLCSRSAGAYGLPAVQHDRLNEAAQFHRDSALESASWGLGQVMGYHWKSLNYSSLQIFINAMYQDEASQLDAMCRFIEKNNLIAALKRKDWKAFAKGYNGAEYAKNQYDVKLANAYKKWKK